MAKIQKLEVVAPDKDQVYRGREESRLSLPRNEGPWVMLTLDEASFAAVQQKIKDTPIKGVNADLYIKDDGTNWWQELNDAAASLHANDTHMINVFVTENPTHTIIIEKSQADVKKDAEHWASHNEEYGSRGSRAFDAGDPQLIIRGLKDLGIDIPDNFERDLREGFAKATPKRGTPPKSVARHKAYSDALKLERTFSQTPDAADRAAIGEKIKASMDEYYGIYSDTPGTSHVVDYVQRSAEKTR